MFTTIADLRLLTLGGDKPDLVAWTVDHRTACRVVHVRMMS